LVSNLKVTVSQALLTLAASGETYGDVLAASDFDVGLYRPEGRDPQGPHKRDEIYVVATGTGTFVRGEERTDFKPGDLLFVPAGVEHRFEAFSADFSTWVVFFGAKPGR
jgi:mannose-6-phosphate isomerase-like protein (cupin superfamily)